MAYVTKFTIDPSWRVIFKDLSIDANLVLKRAKLPCDLFSRKNATVSAKDYFQFWNALEESFTDSTFPLKIAKNIKTEAFHPLFFAALSSPNLNIAAGRISKYKSLVGPMTFIVNINKNETIITLDCLNIENPLPDSLAAMELSFLVHLARIATREEIKPLLVTSTTVLMNSKIYADFLGVMPVKSKKNQIIFSANDANLPFLTENYSRWDILKPQFVERLSDLTHEASFASRVRSSLFELIPSGLSTTEQVAKKLAISKRTLQRYLSNEKTSFQKELNKTRENLARHYLTTSSLTISDISFLLGFDDPNSFARAFRTWTGKTPGKMRVNL